MSHIQCWHVDTSRPWEHMQCRQNLYRSCWACSPPSRAPPHSVLGIKTCHSSGRSDKQLDLSTRVIATNSLARCTLWWWRCSVPSTLIPLLRPVPSVLRARRRHRYPCIVSQQLTHMAADTYVLQTLPQMLGLLQAHFEGWRVFSWVRMLVDTRLVKSWFGKASKV